MLPAGHVPPPTGAEVTVAAPSNSTARLPDLDAFSMFGDVQPGTIPLIVKKPDGSPEQLSVPLNSTVDDIKTTLQRQCSIDDENLTLSFGNADLDPSATLVDTPIVETYEHAGSLLQIIATSDQDADTKAAAMDSACAVVESISNGITDMEALCEAAVNTDGFPNMTEALAPGAQSDGKFKGNESVRQRAAEEQTGQQQLEKSGAELVDDAIEAAARATTTPTALKENLSRRLPNLFPSQNATAQLQQTTQPANEPQPSISSIRDRRRKAREAAVSTDVMTDPQQMKSSMGMTIDDDIGISTYNKPLPPDLGDKQDGVLEGATELKKGGESPGGGTNVILAHSGRTTWLDDVMKTWEVKTVRQSGVLEKSKDGQDVNQYLDDLEAEAIHESDDDEDMEGDTDDPSGEISEALKAQLNTSATSASPLMTRPSCSTTSSTTNDTTTTNATNKTSAHSNSQTQTQSLTQSFTQSLTQSQTHTHTDSQTQTRPQMPYPIPPPPAHAHSPPFLANGFPNMGPATPTTSTTSGSSSAPVRRATRIAPAPSPTGNGFTPNLAMFQGCPPAPGTWTTPHAATVPGPKKRGRKRKNPQLTEEERALVRKEQNRESARLSRVRRKVIAAEYEDKLNGLINENSMLRKHVEGLNNRLAYLQSILTVTVRPGENSSEPAAPPGAVNATPASNSK